MRLHGGARATELTTPFEPHTFSGDAADRLQAGRRAGSRFQRDVPARSRARERHRRSQGRGGVRARAVPARSMRRRERTNAAARRSRRSGSKPVMRFSSPRPAERHAEPCDPAARRGPGRARRQRRLSMRLFAADALTPDGWKRDVAVEIVADGTIETVSRRRSRQWRGTRRPDRCCRECRTCTRTRSSARSPDAPGRASADGDSFWTWRQAMYAFVDRIDADAFEAIAAQAYVEMLKGGIHGGRRVPLRSSRSARQAVRRSGGTRAPDRRRRLRDRHRAHAAAGPLRPCRIRRNAARHGSAAVRAHARLVCAPGRDACPRCRGQRTGIWASRHTACAP